MKQNLIVLAAKGWSLTDEKTGEEREGVSIHYLMTDTLKPYVDSTNGLVGYQPVKQSITIDEAKKMVKVPGVYEGDFNLVASQGKNILKLTSMKFLKPVEE